MTRDWWKLRRAEFDLYASELVIDEVKAGEARLAGHRLELLEGIPILAVTSEILEDTRCRAYARRKNSWEMRREAYAAKFDYDLARMFEDLKKKEAQEDPARLATLKPVKPHQQRA